MTEFIAKCIVMYAIVVACCYFAIPGYSKPNNESIKEFNNILLMSQLDEIQSQLENEEADFTEIQNQLEEIQDAVILDSYE